MENVLNVLRDVRQERSRQHELWGQQNLPDGTGDQASRDDMLRAKQAENIAFSNGEGTWRHILHEEVCEAFAETDLSRLRAELIQVAAVAVAWVEAIDRRPS